MPTDRKTLEALRERVRKAEGPDRELDAEIMFDLFAKPAGQKDDGGPSGYLWPEDNPSWSFGIRFPGKDREWFKEVRKRNDGETLVIERDHALVLMNALRIPRLSASIDATVALVQRTRPGWFWRAGYVPNVHWRDGRGYEHWAHISRTNASNCERGDEATGWDNSVPLALLDALLSALLAESDADASDQKKLTPGQRKLLEPFELHFVAMYQTIIDMSDDELAVVLDAAIVPNQTNCWFITYWAAQFAEREARREQYSRERAKAEKADA